MRTSLRLITPPINYPVEGDEMMRFLEFSTDNELGKLNQQLVEDLIGAATATCEDFCGRAFITQELEMVMTPELIPTQTAGMLTWAYELLPASVMIWRPPLQEVVSIKVVDLEGVEHTQATDHYVVNTDHEPGIVGLSYQGWWEYYIRGYYKIRYKAGYGDTIDKVPPDIRSAIRMTVAQWYMQKEASDYTLPISALAKLAPYVIHNWELK